MTGIELTSHGRREPRNVPIYRRNRHKMITMGGEIGDGVCSITWFRPLRRAALEHLEPAQSWPAHGGDIDQPQLVVLGGQRPKALMARASWSRNTWASSHPS